MIKQDEYGRLYTTSKSFADNYRIESEGNYSFIKDQRKRRRIEEQNKYINFYHYDRATKRYYLPGSAYDLDPISMGEYTAEYEPGKPMASYQVQAIEAVGNFRTKGLLLRSGEGTGKSAMARAIAEAVTNAGTQVCIVTSVKDVEIELKKEIPFAEVMCMPTFTKRYDELNDGRFLIFDEGHHTSKKKNSELVMRKGRFVLSTASPDRASEYAEDGFLMIAGSMHETNQEALPIKVSYLRMDHQVTPEQMAEATEGLAEDSPIRWSKLLAILPERNKKIVEFSVKSWQKHKKVLVATRFVDHAEYLYNEIEKRCPNVLLYTGTTDKKIVKEFIAKHDNYILVCSIGVVKEGFNVKDLMVGILAANIASYTPFRQFAGRMRRRSPGKTHGHLIDFYDSVTLVSPMGKGRRKYLNFKKRKKIGQKLGFYYQQIPNDNEAS